jgi:hypothetical protein
MLSFPTRFSRSAKDPKLIVLAAAAISYVDILDARELSMNLNLLLQACVIMVV